MAFLQITLHADIDCVVKSNKCFESGPDNWREVNDDGLKLLLLLDLKRYRNEFSKEENLQDEWEVAVSNPGKYVNLLVGQKKERRGSKGRDGRGELLQ